MEEKEKKEKLLKEFVSLRQEVTRLKKKETEHRKIQKMLNENIEKMRKTLRAMINTLIFLVEEKDPYTAGHQTKVAKLSCAIAREMGLSEERINTLELAATIHDIGKVNIPFEILNKPDRLTRAQFGMVKTHSQTGYSIVKSMNFPSPVADIILQHHERIDGSGYPQGLAGDDIMIEARILGVADVIEAMSSRRAYRPAHSIDDCLEEIWQKRNISYDQDAADICMDLFTRKDFNFTE